MWEHFTAYGPFKLAGDFPLVPRVVSTMWKSMRNSGSGVTAVNQSYVHEVS